MEQEFTDASIQDEYQKLGRPVPIWTDNQYILFT